MKFALLLIPFAISLLVVDAPAQTRLMNSMKIVNSSTRTGQIWEPSTSNSQNHGFTFPSTIGSTGNVIAVQSVNDAVAGFAWTAPAGGYTDLSSVTNADVTTNNTWATGAAITLNQGKWYRIVGEFRVYRVDPGGGGKSDEIKVALSAMPANSVAEFMVECINCVSPTNMPLRLSTTGAASLESTTIDPNPSTDAVGPANTFLYRLEGVIQPGGAAGTGTGSVSFGFQKTSSGNSTVLVTGSYWTAFPLPD